MILQVLKTQDVPAPSILPIKSVIEATTFLPKSIREGATENKKLKSELLSFLELT